MALQALTGLDATSRQACVATKAEVTDELQVTGAIEIAASTLQIKTDGINDLMIDWGTTGSKVSAADVPIADAGSIITATEVEGALQENRTAIDAIENNTITSTDGSISVSGTVGGDNQIVETVFSTAGLANRSIDAADLLAVTNGLGGDLVGIYDAGGIITATNVTDALQENRTAIDAIEDNTITGNSGIHSGGTVGGDDQALKLDTLTEDWDTGVNFKITGMKTPTGASDAATKGYVDSVAAGLDPKESVRVATVEMLDMDTDITGTPVYNSVGGSSSRGQITGTLGVADTFGIDGVALVTGDRMLIKDEGRYTAEVHSVDTVANVASGLNNDYFVIYNTPNDGYYVWYNCNAAGSDPAPSPPAGVNYTEVEVTLTTDDSADAVAIATKTALDASTWAGSVGRSTNELTIYNNLGGNVTDVAEGVGTGFTFNTDSQGTGMGAAANGLYDVTISGTSLTLDRSADFDSDPEVTAGAFSFVEEGTTQDNSGWVVTTDNPIVIGGADGDPLDWVQFSGAGQVTAGTGLTKTGNTINAIGGDGIIANTDNLAVDEAYAFQWTGNQDFVSGELDFAVGTLKMAGTAISSTAAELNILDGVTASTAELNILTSCTASTTDLNLLAGQAAGGLTSADLTKLSNIDATDVEIDQLDGTTNIAEADTFFGATDITGAEAEELTDGSTTTKHQHALATGANDVTATAAEVNLIDGSIAGTAVASKAAVLGANKELNEFHTAALYLGAAAGSLVSSTAAELNNLDGPVAGTAMASKALVLGATKNIDTIDITKDGLEIGGTAMTCTATELNQLDGTTNIAEADTFFANTDITGAEAQTLTGGATSNADALHEHARVADDTEVAGAGNILIRRVVYVDPTTGKMLHANGAAIATASVTGVALDAAAADAAVNLAYSGRVNLDLPATHGAVTRGDILFLGQLAGGYVVPAVNVAFTAGYAILPIAIAVVSVAANTGGTIAAVLGAVGIHKAKA